MTVLFIFSLYNKCFEVATRSDLIYVGAKITLNKSIVTMEILNWTLLDMAQLQGG